jgi:hypothetical protein
VRRYQRILIPDPPGIHCSRLDPDRNNGQQTAPEHPDLHAWFMSAEAAWAAPDRRLGARVLGDLRAVGNPDHDGADSGEVVSLCIASAWRELPLLPLRERHESGWAGSRSPVDDRLTAPSPGGSVGIMGCAELIEILEHRLGMHVAASPTSAPSAW